jgi:predicted acetyltransferase
MPELILPTTAVHASFLTAMAEFRAEGRGGAADRTMVGQEIDTYASTWEAPAGFSSYVSWLRDQALNEARRPAHMVPSTTLWWTDGPEYLGRLAIRHRLTRHLLDVGGHIGYDVRPSARRRGHATAMLAAALPWARQLGIDPALVTCDADNVGSRKVIEANHGKLEDQRGIKLRFWVPTSWTRT